MLKIYRNDIWIDKETRQTLWYPIIKFENLMKLEQTKVVGGGGAGGSMWYTYASKIVTYGEEFQITFSCDMSFKKFPFDSHDCNLSYAPFSKYE